MVNNIALVILAAGNSSRMGSPKGLLAVGDKSLLEFQLDCFPAKEQVVVVGKDYAVYKKILLSRAVKVVHNPNVDDGPFSSLWLALKMVKASRVFVTHIDTPLPNLEVLDHLASCSADVVHPQNPLTCKGGHPILLNRAVINKILKIESPRECRLDYFIKSFKPLRVSIDHPFCSLNLNTSSDFENFLELIATSSV